MVTAKHPFIQLRARIRDAARQYRHNNDVSKSLFHPEHGFVYGYDMQAVDKALEAYEATLPSEFNPEEHVLTIEEKLLREAQAIAVCNDDMDIRDFARSVAGYLVMNTPLSTRRKKNPLRLLKTEYLGKPTTIEEE